MTTQASLDIAYSAGYAANKNDKLKSAAMCDTFRTLIESFQVGDERFHAIAQAWYRGFDEYTNELLAQLEA